MSRDFHFVFVLSFSFKFSIFGVSTEWMITLFKHGWKHQSNIENKLKILKNCFTYLPCESTDQKTIYGNFS